MAKVSIYHYHNLFYFLFLRLAYSAVTPFQKNNGLTANIATLQKAQKTDRPLATKANMSTTN